MVWYLIEYRTAPPSMGRCGSLPALLDAQGAFTAAGDAEQPATASGRRRRAAGDHSSGGICSSLNESRKYKFDRDRGSGYLILKPGQYALVTLVLSCNQIHDKHVPRQNARGTDGICSSQTSQGKQIWSGQGFRITDSETVHSSET